MFIIKYLLQKLCHIFWYYSNMWLFSVYLSMNKGSGFRVIIMYLCLYNKKCRAIIFVRHFIFCVI